MKTLPPLTTREWLGWSFLSALIFSAGAFFTILELSEANYASDYALYAMSFASVLQLLAWWIGYLSRTMTVTSPGSLQLVPDFRRGVLLNTLLLMIGLSTLLAMIFASVHAILPLIWVAALSHVSRSTITQRHILAVGSWLWFFALIAWQTFDLLPIAAKIPPPSIAHGVLLWGTAATLTGFIAIWRLHRWMGAVCMLVYMAMLFSRSILPGFPLMTDLLSPDFVASPAYALGMLLAGAVLCGWGLQLLGGQRGERAIAYFKSSAELRAAMRALTEPAARTNWSSSTRRNHIGDYSFNRALRQPHQAMRMMPFALGPRFEWQSFTIVSLLSSVLVLLMPLLPMVGKTPEFTAMAGFMPLVAFLGSVFIPDMLLRTHREQGLLSLTPAWPSKNPLNRWLIRFIALRVVIAWTICVAVMTTMNLLYGFPLSNLVVATVIASLCAIMLFGYSLKRYPRIRLGQRFSSIPIMALLVLCFVIGLIAYIVAPTATTIIVMALVIIGYAIWRTLNVIRGPAILPATRLAKG